MSYLNVPIDSSLKRQLKAQVAMEGTTLRAFVERELQGALAALSTEGRISIIKGEPAHVD